MESGSTLESMDERRSHTTLPFVLDDSERQSREHNLLVGSMNAATKRKAGGWKSEKLSGIAITKNLNPGEKLHPKIIEGRLIWFLMEPSPFHESQGMEENLESHLCHINAMKGSFCPRDFLAEMSGDFVNNGSETSNFQEFLKEACLILSEYFPHWRKRKLKNSSITLAQFLMVEKYVDKSVKEIHKQLYVESFGDRETFIRSLVEELKKTDQAEKMMTSGRIMSVETDVFGEEDSEQNVGSQTPSDLISWTLSRFEDKTMNETTKFLKVFAEKNGMFTVGVAHARLKKTVMDNGEVFMKLPPMKKDAKIFTKMESSSHTGRGNTGAAQCSVVPFMSLEEDLRERLVQYFNLEVPNHGRVEEVPEVLDPSVMSSQDFPQFSQSQSTETLKVCNTCEFTSRSAREFEEHVGTHPKFDLCGESLKAERDLIHHFEKVHKTFSCEICQKDVRINDRSKHKKMHEVQNTFAKYLNEDYKKKSKGSKKGNSAPKLNGYTMFIKENRGETQRQNPTMKPKDVIALLATNWRNLSEEEKTLFKVRADDENKKMGVTRNEESNLEV